MTYSKLVEHARYVSDHRRTNAYRKALELLLPSDAVVLDLGAGTGVLGILAAQAGARRVICVEEAPIASLIAAHAATNGVGDRVEVHEISSFDLELETQVDLVVCDQAYGIGTQAALGRLLADARARLLQPGGLTIPGSMTIQAAGVYAPTVEATLERSRGSDTGLRFPALADAARNTVHLVRAERLETIGEPVTISDAQPTWSTAPIRWAGQLPAIERPCTGIAVWWTVELAPAVAISNLGSGRIDRDVAVLPLPSAPREGITIDVEIDIRPELNTITWSVGRGDDRTTASTFHGQLLSAKGFGHR